MVAAGRSNPLRRAGSFLALLAFEAGAVALLTWLGRVPALRIPWSGLTPWLLNSPVEDVLAAVLRMIALLIAWWLLGSHLLYLVASLTRVPAAIRAFRFLTLPLVRRVTDHAVAVTLATSLVGTGTGGALAATAPVVAAAPLRPGPAAAQVQPRADAGGGAPGPAYVPQAAGPAAAQVEPRADAGEAGGGAGPAYVPQAAGLAAAQRQPARGEYVPDPAGPPPRAAAQPTTTAGQPPTSTSTSTSTTRPTNTTRGREYTPEPAGPPRAAQPPRTTAPGGPATSTTRPPTSTSPPTTAPEEGGPGSTQPPPPREGQRSRAHRVVEGDNLWTIARDHLAAVTDQPADVLSDHEIARYWLRVVAVNRSSLRSGDPNLIFPGEIVHLPPVGG